MKALINAVSLKNVKKNKMRTREYKAALDDLEDDYWEARNKSFIEEFEDFMSEYVERVPGNFKNITEKDLQGFLDSFTFPEAYEWCAKEFEDRRDAFEDAKMEEARDREMEL